MSRRKQHGRPINGWMVIDKAEGMTSTDVVTRVKRLTQAQKVGHGGTLDPLASGVLPVAIGEATKLSGRMLDADKAYEFTIGFGTQTDTLDGEGVVIATSDVRPTQDEIEAVLPRFTGPIAQMPPAYSALKVDGKRAYDLARAGEEVTLAARQVTIRSLTLVGPDTIAARVSKGTYIRSLARDIALALGTVGHVTMLRRTKAGPFTLESAISLDNLGEIAKARTLEQHLLPLTAGLDDIPALSVSPDQARALRQGRKLIGIAATSGLALAMDGEIPVALVESDGPELRVVRGFNL